MAYRALSTILLGVGDPVNAGEEIPAHYLDTLGEKQPVDFERLLELGAAEQVKPARKSAAKGE